MFKAVKRSAASIFRKKKKRTKVYTLPRPTFQRSPSASFSSWDQCSQQAEARSTTVPSPIPPRGFAGDSFIESNDVSSQIFVGQADGNRDFDGDEDFPATPTRHTRSGAKQGRPDATDIVDVFAVNDSQESEVLRLVNVILEGKQRQALLLTTAILERLHAIAKLRQQLREVESEIATRAEKREGVMARSEVDARRETFAMPGAFPSEESAGSEASRRGLFSALQKRVSIKDRTVERLKAQRSDSMAELDRLKQLVLESLLEAVNGSRVG